MGKKSHFNQPTARTDVSLKQIHWEKYGALNNNMGIPTVNLQSKYTLCKQITIMCQIKV